ncbi:MAG: 5-formyltetrahydrofolate cyclo-ligase [Lachnospiraceae bacterium]|nr:5-formyltetrahydrofolate cyclo-ligase [Lachnospiraceae bacterium]
MTKKDIRESVLFLRNSLDKKEAEYISRGICQDVIELDVYEKATDICLYMSINNEVYLDSLMEASFKEGKRVWLPRVIDKYMEFYSYDTNTKLINGAFGIMEPDSEMKLVPNENTLIIMPGAVYSENKERIGYGGGYYDKYLSEHPECHTVAVCYELQIFPDIPTEAYDIKPEIIVTEERIIE